MNILAIIQARMGSMRLPGKILMDIEGNPMLWHVVRRLGFCKTLNRIVIATSTESQNDVVEEFSRNNGIDCFRGSEDDVLERYIQAARAFKADVIVRITADCPLIDPEVTDKVIKSYVDNANIFDGASNTIKRTYPRGLDTEVVSFLALESVAKKAKEPYQREHVTIYIFEHPELFKISSVQNDVDLSHLRFTVDEKLDLELIRAIYSKIYSKDKLFLLKDILKVLNDNPDLEQINKNVRQKTVLK